MWRCGWRGVFFFFFLTPIPVKKLSAILYKGFIAQCWIIAAHREKLVRGSQFKCHRAVVAIRYDLTIKLWQWVKMWSDDKYGAGTLLQQDKEWLRRCGGYLMSCQILISQKTAKKKTSYNSDNIYYEVKHDEYLYLKIFKDLNFYYMPDSRVCFLSSVFLDHRAASTLSFPQSSEKCVICEQKIIITQNTSIKILFSSCWHVTQAQAKKHSPCCEGHRKLGLSPLSTLPNSDLTDRVGIDRSGWEVMLLYKVFSGRRTRVTVGRKIRDTQLEREKGPELTMWP